MADLKLADLDELEIRIKVCPRGADRAGKPERQTFDVLQIVQDGGAAGPAGTFVQGIRGELAAFLASRGYRVKGLDGGGDV